MANDATARNHTSHSYATCRIKEVCKGSTSDQQTRCNVVEDILTELEPSLCPGMCYYIIVPHRQCGEGNYISTVYMTHVPEGNTVIKIYRAQSTLPTANVTIDAGCDGIEGQEFSDSCEIMVDQSCPGTNVQTFEANQNIALEIKSVTGEKKVAVSFSKQFSTPVTALVTIHDTRAGETDTGDGSQTTENVVEGVDDAASVVKTKLVIDSLVLDIILVDDQGRQIQLDDDHLIHLAFGSNQPGGFKERVCRFFDETEEKWSGHGCHVSDSNETDVTCACNHTTSFAVLLQFEDCTIEGANLKIQTLMTRFFNAISIAALFLSVVIFCYLKLYTSDQVKVHICLAISLALAQLVMLFMDQTQHKGMCRAIAGIMHYLLTAYCISMILEGTLLHRKASRTHKAPVKGWMIILAVWGIPCVMVAVLMGSLIDGYGGECACFLNVQYKTMYIWLTEVCLVVVVNTVLLYLIMRTFVSLKANAKKSDTDRLKATARAVLIMVPMLGMTWVFGLLQAVMKNVFLQWFFILMNALQGPLFFVFQCVMHPEVQKVIGRKRKVGDSSKWAMNTSTSGTGGTQSTDKGTSQFTESKLSKGL
ncbi:adhesion G-protein coupled receptor D1-like [Lytechinus variegatus]|uniref:adhesion G-protein coupled receptor D1-like n=1 Tax=Lytechinus variegatus TaxID=7654 RepID=UPI001BB11C58|nr:adhesion G-protein coupled receptor D1-like [Lytechinus variegatus]